jgi:hypothetical protein
MLKPEVYVSSQEAVNSDLVEIAKRNGDFRRNYGLCIGAFLYLPR